MKVEQSISHKKIFGHDPFAAFFLAGCTIMTGSIGTISQTLHAETANNRKVAVTVYNSNLALIKENRTIPLSKGVAEVRFTDVAQTIIPTSVNVAFEGTVLEQNYRYDLVSVSKILERYLDKDVTLTSEKNEILTGKLLSIQGNEAVLQKSDGGLVMISNVQTYKVSVGALPSGLLTRPTLVWTVETPKTSEQDVKLNYLCTGFSWNAEYVLVLNDDDTRGNLSAWVSVNNSSGTTFENADLKLVAGDVNQGGRQVIPMAYASKRAGNLENAAEDQIQEQEFFEYHLYSIPRPVTLASNEIKQIALFDSPKIPIQKKYYTVSQGYTEEKRKVSVELTFQNTDKNGLGIPFPSGTVRVMKEAQTGKGSDKKSSVEFVGSDNIKHTPRDEKISLKIGNAFDLVADEKLVASKQLGDSGIEQTIEMTVKNRKKSGSEVINVRRSVWGNWEILSSSHNHVQEDASNIFFPITVEAGKEVVLKYKIRMLNK